MSGKCIRSFVLYLLVFISALLAMDSPVSAFVVSTTSSGVEIKWPIPSASYFLNTSGSPSGSLESIQTALQTWSDVPNSSFVFAYAGATTSSSHRIYDGQNIVTFAPMGYTGVLAENAFWYNRVTGQIVDSDIRFNTGYSWSTSGSPDFFDVQSIATHELGHSLSLGDLYGVADSEKTMYGYASLGETNKRTLDPDDIAGIAYLYPGRSLIGVFRNGMWFLDTNGNGAWDGTDTIAYFGLPGDVQVNGDWDGTGTTKIGVFRNGQWYLDNGDGAWAWGTDTYTNFGLPGDVPVTGDWTGTGTTKIGVFRIGQWYLDMDGDGAWNPANDMFTYFGLPGDVPVTGDW